jgi:hypothetical protein
MAIKPTNTPWTYWKHTRCRYLGRYQGDEMRLWKNSPHCPLPYPFLGKLWHNLNGGKSSPEFLSTSVIYNEVPKANNYPICEKSPDLVTLDYVPSSTQS